MSALNSAQSQEIFSKNKNCSRRLTRKEKLNGVEQVSLID
jgi:hypothetical protein